MHPRDIFAPRPDPERRPTDADQIEPVDEIEAVLADPIVRWRAEQFASMNFTPHQARALALNRRVDIHWVRVNLIEKGCDPMVAFDIAS